MRFFLLLWFCLSVGGRVGAQDTRPDDGQPNFVIIMADDMGYGDAGCYWRDAPAATPNIDRMALEGMRFTDFHSSGNVCSPTRAGLLTGRYQQRAGIPGVINADPALAAHNVHLKHEELTFAELLSEHGYKTGLFGKWHLGYDPQFNPVTQGFDQFRGYVSGNIDYLSHYDRMETYDWWDGQQTVVEAGYSTHLITSHSVRFIEQNRDRPFCLYIAHEAVHGPWQGPNDAIQRGPDKALDKQRKKHEALPDMITALDESVGEVLDALKHAGIAENTLVFFFSDNGPAAGSAGPLRGRKGSNWEGGHRVPAIGWWPGKIPAGTVSGQLGISLDLMPTMLSFAGIPQPKDLTLDGMDLSEVLTGNKSFARQLFWNSVAMRDGSWKLMLRGQGLKQGEAGLYNLSTDIAESKNLAKQFPDRVQQMTSAIDAWSIDVNADRLNQQRDQK